MVGEFIKVFFSAYMLSSSLPAGDTFRKRIRYLQYSPRTEDVYVYWIRLFIRFHKLRHPRELGAQEIEAFLPWLANARQVAPSTHK